jgi:hypothetical protein
VRKQRTDRVAQPPYDGKIGWGDDEENVLATMTAPIAHNGGVNGLSREKAALKQS